jgi:hypothetical protein
MIDLGDVYRIRVPVRTPDGALTSPGAATMTITLPDGTTATPSVSLPPAETGIVIVDYPTVQAGRHQVVLTTTSPQTAYRDVFDVRQADLQNIVSLADAKHHLNISNDGSDDELRGFIEATTGIAAYYCGTLFPATYVETYEACGKALALRHWPVLSVSAITAVGTASVVDPDDVDVDEHGILRAESSMSGTVRVTYRAGNTIMPANVTRGGLIIIQHMWETQRSRNSRGPTTPRSEDFMNAQDVSGRFYTVPRRAVELFQGAIQDGFA